MNRSLRSSSQSALPDPGAAQFIHNLSQQQLQHLQFSVPPKDTPARFSQFLEEPRQPPVPKRFTFDALDLATRRSEIDRVKEFKHVRNLSSKDEKSFRAQVKHTRNESIKSARSIASTTASMITVSLKKEAEKVASTDWRFYTTALCLCLVNLVASWDAFTLPIAIPTIAKAIGSSGFESFWLGIAFFTAATCVVPLFASLSDIFGRRAMLVTSLSFFTVGSVVAPTIGTVPGMHLGRSIQGIGGGGIYILSNLIVSDLLSAVDRRKWSAIMGAAWAIGAITGPAIGGIVADARQYRWIFWLDLPICILALTYFSFFAQLRSATEGSILPKLRNIDWLGYFLFAGSLVSLFLGLTWGGTVQPWFSFRTILPLQFGLIGFVCFIVWSMFSPFPAIIPVRSFFDSTSFTLYFGSLIQGTTLFSALYFLPLYFSIVKTDQSFAQTGICLFAWSIPLGVLAFVTFLLISRTTFLRSMVWLGWLLVVIGLSLTTLLARTSSTAMWVTVAIVSGSGFGILYPSLSTFSTLVAQPPSEDDKLQLGVTNLTFFQTLGQTLGVVIGSTIFQNLVYKKLLEIPELAPTSAWQSAMNSVALVNLIRQMTGADGSFKTEVSDAYIDAMRPIWITISVLAGVAMAASFFMKTIEIPRDRDLEMRSIEETYIV